MSKHNPGDEHDLRAERVPVDDRLVERNELREHAHPPSFTESVLSLPAYFGLNVEAQSASL